MILRSKLFAVASVFAASAVAVACGQDASRNADTAVAATTQASSPATSTAVQTETVDAGSACNLVPRDEVATVLGPNTIVALSATPRCRYEAGDKTLAIESGALTSGYDNLEDYKSFNSGFAFEEPVPGIGDAAFFSHVSSELSFVKGDKLVTLQVHLDAESEDYNAASDKNEELTALTSWGKSAAARL
ncbi:hypothetical protein [Antrihabitans stalactiti]|uniref:DUF3558 domain-containing protein n=1 Tax=Antrihabitans stalactiti TaxID=2584121 RepID=A0A848KAG1_9NOCA|nr:hypothetical protein [Antrihabitans stalactiti]NMN94656.1 hypothetical protein [Antrihabitans stalactiti]